MKNKTMMLAVFIAIVSVCAMSALAITTVTLSGPTNYTTNATKSNHTFVWTVADVDEFANDAKCNLTLTDRTGVTNTWLTINATDGVAKRYDANFSSGTSQGRVNWTVSCTNSSGPYVTANGYNFMYDRTGPLYANTTVTVLVAATTGTTGNYSISVDVIDAYNAVGTPVRLWYGFAGTADTARTMWRSGTSNTYTTSVLVAQGNTLTYEITATDSLGTSSTSTTATYGVVGNTACDNAKYVIFAGFALLAIGAIVVAAWALINIGTLDAHILSLMIAAVITLGVVLMVGYYMIYYVAVITCV
jgi:hypothetical protein